MKHTESDVRALYEELPYPPRSPTDIAPAAAFPTHLPAINHHIFAGRRDFSKPFRALVAGGGTGDAVLMLGAPLARMGTPAEIVYLDLSERSCAIARERALAAGLLNVDFRVGSLNDLDRMDLGRFDYIDCCGVLHHLDDPAHGLRNLAGCLEDDGGIGIMVYGELGRTGVYHTQSVLAHLRDASDDYGARVELARRLLSALPKTNWLRLNPSFEIDAPQSDEEIADLFLHPCDRAYTVSGIRALLESAGMDAASFLPALYYMPEIAVPDPDLRRRFAALPWWTRCEVGELLQGSLRKHVFFAKHAGQCERSGPDLGPGTIPVPRRRATFAQIAEGMTDASGTVTIQVQIEGVLRSITLPYQPLTRAIIEALDGRTALGDLHTALAPGIAWADFAATFGQIYRPLHAIGEMFLTLTPLPA